MDKAHVPTLGKSSQSQQPYVTSNHINQGTQARAKYPTSGIAVSKGHQGVALFLALIETMGFYPPLKGSIILRANVITVRQ